MISNSAPTISRSVPAAGVAAACTRQGQYGGCEHRGSSVRARRPGSSCLAGPWRGRRLYFRRGRRPAATSGVLRAGSLLEGRMFKRGLASDIGGQRAGWSSPNSALHRTVVSRLRRLTRAGYLALGASTSAVCSLSPKCIERSLTVQHRSACFLGAGPYACPSFRRLHAPMCMISNSAPPVSRTDPAAGVAAACTRQGQHGGCERRGSFVRAGRRGCSCIAGPWRGRQLYFRRGRWPAARGGVLREVSLLEGRVFKRGLASDIGGQRASWRSPNSALHRTVVSRLRRLTPAGDLARWASRVVKET